MPTARDFRGSRRALALVFRDGPKTAGEASQALDRPTGSFYNLLKRMCAEGLLVADTEELGRGTRYELSADAMRVLLAMDAPEPEAAPGSVAAGDVLLWVEEPKNVRAVPGVLAQEWVGANVRWSARVVGGWLLAVDGADELVELRLCDALQLAGAEARALVVRKVAGGADMAALYDMFLGVEQG